MKIKKSYFLFVGLIFSFQQKTVFAEAIAPNYYQNTPAYSNPRGAVSLEEYSQQELETLAAIAQGENQFQGNSSLKLTASDHFYGIEDGLPYKNFVGEDGILQLYNESSLMTTNMVEQAAEYWNLLAGQTVVEVVGTQEESDEVIYDVAGNTGTLGGQTVLYGIRFYPDSWLVLQSSEYTETEKHLWKMATLIHEIGHGLGVPHLGGGRDGGNASADPANIHYGTEFMAPWRPKENPTGIISSQQVAASLALAGLTYQKSQKLASWILEEPNASVSYNTNKTITTTIPFGVEIYFKGNYLNQIKTANTSGIIDKNYNVYQVDDQIITEKRLGQAIFLGTTESLGLRDKEVTITNVYSSNYANLRYCRVTFNGTSYVIDASAFEEKVSELGMQIDAPNNFIQSYTPIKEEITLYQNYNLSTFEDRTLEKTAIDQGIFVGTTASKGFINKTVTATAYYTSNSGYTYYGFVVDGNYYVVNSTAAKQ